MRDNISPEEKLLRLIRGQKKQELAPEKKTLTPEKKPQEPKPIVAIASVKPTINAAPSVLFQKYLVFDYVQKIIFAAFAVSLLCLAFIFIHPLFGLKKVELPKAKAGEEKIAESVKEPQSEEKSYEFYLQALENKEIFSAPSLTETKTEAEAVPVSNMAQDLINDINLLGIISGEPPQAVIEYKKTQKTYYVTKGQFVGELRLEDIQEGKVIMSYKGQKFEIYL